MAQATIRKVPFFVYPDIYQSDAAEIDETIRAVCSRGAFIMQRELEEFESNVAELVGVKHVIGMANATDALHLAVRAAGIGPGDEVIFSSHTMVATPAAVHYAGATPIPVECGEDHLIDADAVRAAITENTKAIMPTQLNGRTAAMDPIVALAEQHGLMILEDAAQALGSRYKGQAAGSFGLGGCISFYPAKTLGCLGDGGCWLTNDDHMNDQLRLLRDHGRDSSGDVSVWGLNSRLDNVQAAILNIKLKRYPEAITRRREIASLYDSMLRDVPGLKLPPAPTSDGEHFDIFQNYEIEAEDRTELRAYLSERGIGSLIPWGGKATHQFDKLGFHQSLPFTERLFERVLMIPLNTSMTDEDVVHVAQTITQFYQDKDF
ncbi:DegT/DnrJ/EryC1/StrS family aminotransferase [Roseimaritima sediminicola]|uniref:DegT/DnrJ/EryC1/StrS family aminotransferase n=1 Tax=Roseimaritima sediminicola TaxID=2662066 RepID=UPI0012982A95|nr:DegT/DnrJ/EryC1/StrS family aminotransferase [Roseimaritima sediminicola]